MDWLTSSSFPGLTEMMFVAKTVELIMETIYQFYLNIRVPKYFFIKRSEIIFWYRSTGLGTIYTESGCLKTLGAVHGSYSAPIKPIIAIGANQI